MENRAHALVAGLFVIIFGIAIAISGWWFGGVRLETRDIMLVTQRNVTGLNPLAQVRFRGIRAGKVIDISLDPEDARNILVLIRIDAALPVTKGTVAQLNYQGLTGLAYVQLEDTGKDAEPLPVNDDMPPRIRIQATIFDSFGDRATDILGNLAQVSSSLNRLLDERNLRNLNRTFDNVATASEGLKELPQVVASMKAVLSVENMQRLHRILAHVERTAGETAPLTAEMRALVASMQTVSHRLDEMLVQTGGEFSSVSLPRFNALVGELHGNSRQLRRILDGIEAEPQSILFGRTPALPGPGEPGFGSSIK